jgi:glycosyltransferase involved in cell wall biosynthesis
VRRKFTFCAPQQLRHDAVMISVVIPTANSERHLARCFDSLIPAAVGGMVREVIVSDAGSSDGTLAIADAAGAHVIRTRKGRGAQFMDGAAIAKSDWLLFLHPETALEPGWDAEVESFISQAELERPRAAVFRFALEDFGGEARRAEAKASLRTMLFALPYGDQGLLIPKRLYQKVGGYRALSRMEDADLVRRIGRRRLIRLRARAVNAARPHNSALRGLALTLLHAIRVPSRLLANL